MDYTRQKAAQCALRVATSILEPLGYTFSLTTSEIESAEDGVVLMISSEDASYIIGNDGDKLDDLQYLVNRIIQAEWEDAPRIRVDCDGYRQRTESRLLRRARSRAERVLQTGRPLLMERLNAYQRRLVHQELATIPGIRTSSEDTDSRFKRITISRA